MLGALPSHKHTQMTGLRFETAFCIDTTLWKLELCYPWKKQWIKEALSSIKNALS